LKEIHIIITKEKIMGLNEPPQEKISMICHQGKLPEAIL
jgi:hypothetical protein